MKKFLTALGCFAALILLIIIAAVIAVAMAVGHNDSQDNLQNVGFGGGIADDAPVPPDIESIILHSIGKYGCTQVTPSLIAAQLSAESAFNADAQSHDRNGKPIADGISQFTPGTWAAHGVDGNGDGTKDIWNPQDAIPAQISYDCYLAKVVKGVPGAATDNMLAAYNAGAGAVLNANGIPPYDETRNYVTQIRALATKWASTVDSDTPLAAGSAGASQAIATAEQALGTMYQWGGDCRPPFDQARNNGCDCSSLVQYAWASAGVNLPRVTTDQVKSGTSVPDTAHLAPGDLLFTRGSDGGTPSAPGHVGMYIGHNQVIEAPHTGAPVRLTPLSQWTGSAGFNNTIVAIRHVGSAGVS